MNEKINKKIEKDPKKSINVQNKKMDVPNKKIDVPKPQKLLKSNSINPKVSSSKNIESSTTEEIDQKQKIKEKNLEYKKENQNFKLKNELLKNENKDLKRNIEEKDKLIELLQKKYENYDFSQKRVLLLKAQVLKFENHIKYLTNSIKSNQTISIEIEYLINQALNLLENILSSNDLASIQSKIETKIGDFRILQAKMTQSINLQNLQYEKFLNKSYLKLNQSDKLLSKKNLIFSLEEDLNFMFKKIIGDKSMELNENHAIFTVKSKNILEKLFFLGLKIEDFFNDEKTEFSNKLLQNYQKNLETANSFSKKIYDDHNLIFKTEKNLFENFGNKHNKFTFFFDNILQLSKELDSDALKIIEKYNKEGIFDKILQEFLERNSKFFQNNSEMKNEFVDLIIFFKNDAFFLTKIINILEYSLFHNSILLKDLNAFLETKFTKLIEAIKENVFGPINDMIMVLNQKNEMNLQSYYLQISNLFEFNSQKIVKTLEILLGLKRTSDEFNLEKEELSAKFIIETFRLIEKKFFLNNNISK